MLDSAPTVRRATPPPPARVVANRWVDLEVPALGAWQPTRPLSVVIPIYQTIDALRLTLAALGAQTYPAHLIQVVIADDGSDPPIAIPADVAEMTKRLDVRIVRQERRGFGAARARNTGAAAAEGDVLLFLDCDMAPDPQWAEAHARWHHAASDVATFGFRTHVDFDGVSPAGVHDAALAGALSPLFEGREQVAPEWIEAQMERTNSLTSRAEDLFRICTSGNLGVGARMFREVGGFDPAFAGYGGEDTELGYRLFTHGSVLVPDRHAHCWHQGTREWSDNPEKAAEGKQQRARLAQLIAERSFRRFMPGRSYTVPYLVARVSVTDQDSAQVTRVVESILANRFHDLVVCLSVGAAHPERVWLEHQFAGDARVRVGTDLDDLALFPFSPIRIDVPPVALLGDGALETIVQRMWNQPVGAINATIPGTDAVVRAVWTRALRRALRLGSNPKAAPAVVRELYGEEIVPGSEVGAIRFYRWIPIPVSVPTAATSNLPQQVTELAARLTIAQERARRSAAGPAGRIALLRRGLGRLSRVRSLGDLRVLMQALRRRV